MKVLSLVIFSCIVFPVVGQVPGFLVGILATLAPTIFNTFAFLATGIFNNFVGLALGPVDPFPLNQGINKELGTFDIDSCGGEVTVVFNATFNEILGLAAMEIASLSMSSFGIDDSGFVSGFEIVAASDAIVATFDGGIGIPGCDSYEGNSFAGEAGIGSPSFTFSFDSNVTIFTGFSIDSVNITSFELGWDSVGINITEGDLGEAEGVLESMEEQLVSVAESLVSGFVNAELLQSLLDGILPFP